MHSFGMRIVGVWSSFATATILSFGPASIAAAEQSSTSSVGLEEIIVTATKRQENLQVVPIAVSAFSSELVQETRIQNFSDLATLVPGASFVTISGASGSQVQLRGQIATDDGPGFDTPVGIFVDDIYYGSVASFQPDFFDIEQLAVLRGPQGTTFGRNTVGGALQVVSKKPEPGAADAEVSLAVGNRSRFESDGFVNLPLSDTLTTRLAYSLRTVDGDIHNLVNDTYVRAKNTGSARGAFLWQPTDSLDVLTSVTYTHETGNGEGPIVTGEGALVAQLARPIDSGVTLIDDDGRRERDIWNAFVRADWDMGWATLTSISGYRSLDSYYREDNDGTPLENQSPMKADLNDERQFSQELRLTSPDGERLQWIAGIYLLDLDVYRAENYTFGGVPPYYMDVLAGGARQHVFISGRTETKSVAPFGEVKWNLTDAFSIAGGLRYTYDSKDQETDQVNLTTPGGSTVFFGLPKHVKADANWDAWTPRLSLNYQLSPDVFLYGSAAKGFKSGGFNYAAPTVEQAVNPILPEETWSYEVGAKTDWLGGALRANVAFYKAITSDLQVRSIVGTVVQINNAGEATTEGAEVELTARPTDQLTLGLNFAYTNAEFTDYAGCAGTAAAPIDCTGNKIPLVPEQTWTLSAKYDWPLESGANLSLRGEGYWSSKYELHVLNNLDMPVKQTDRKNILDVFATYESAEDKWDVQLWARNLLDERSVRYAFNAYWYMLTAAEVASGLNQGYMNIVSEGRSYGATLTFRF